MLGVSILCLTFSFASADAMINNLIMAGTSTVSPLSANYGIENTGTPKIMPPYQDVEVNRGNINLHDCPNTAILLNILNFMTKILSNDDKNMLEPDKFKHVLTIVKNFLETAPFNSGNTDLFDKLKNMDQHLIEINDPYNDNGLRESINGNSKVQAPIEYTSTQQNQNCHEIFNNLMKLINSAYSQVLKYCAVTERCYSNNGNINPNIYSSIEPFYLDASLQPNFAPNKHQEPVKYFPSLENKLTESNIAGADLINFMKNHEGKDINNLMTILQNHRPSESVNIISTYPSRVVDVPNQVLNVDSGNALMYNLTPSVKTHVEKPSYEINVQKLPLNPQLAMQFTNKTPNLKTIPWQNMFSGLKGLPNTYENQHNVKLLEQKLYGSNNLGLTSSIYPGTDKVSYIILNGKIVPIKTPTIELKQDTKPNIANYPNFKPNDINTNPNVLNDLMKLYLNNPQQNLHSTNINLSPVKHLPELSTGNIKYINNIQSKANPQNVQLPNNHYLKTGLHNQVVQNLPPNALLKTLQYNPNHNSQQGNVITYEPQKYLNQNQLLYGYNPLLNVLDLNKIYGIPTHNYKHNIDTVNTFSDNNKQENYANQLNLNQLLGVTNLAKLNSMPNKNRIIELTYVLKRPKPVYDSEYYVKYRLPYQTFVYNLQNFLIKKPHLRNEPNQLYQVLLVGSNVTDTSNDLKGLNYDEIIKLTSTNGTLVTAKLLKSNDTVLDNTLKLVQRLNSNIPLENIINLNATKNLRMDIKEAKTNSSRDSIVLNIPQINTQRRGLYQYLNYPVNALSQYHSGLTYYPYTTYQANPTIYTAPLKYGYNTINTNAQLPLVYSQSVAKSYPQLLNYYGK